MIGDEPANGLLLFGFEPPAHRTPPPPGAQTRHSRRLLSANPSVNGLTGDSEKAGHFRFGVSPLEDGHRLEADRFLRLRRQRAEILMDHARKLSSLCLCVKYLMLRLIAHLTLGCGPAALCISSFSPLVLGA